MQKQSLDFPRKSGCFYFLRFSSIRKIPCIRVSVRLLPNTFEHSSILRNSSAVSRIFKLLLRELSALGGLPVLGLIISPHFCPRIYNILCTRKSQVLFSTPYIL
nr:MAG TPA: hypothetical protein [Caudoviricetes sp.]